MRITSRFLAATLGAFACVSVFAPLASAADNTPPTMPHFAAASASAANLAPSVGLDFGVSSDRWGVRDYAIYRNDKVGSIARIGASATHRYVDKAVLAGTEYTYTVRAVDWSNNYSEPIAVTVKTNGTRMAFSPFYVAKPNGLSLSAQSHTALLLAISARADKNARYNIYRGADPIPFAAIDGEIGSENGVSVTKFTDTGLTANTSYTYTVRSVDSAGALGEPISVTASTLVAPPVVPKKCVASFFGICIAWK